jgi:hypothetical protein
MLVGSQNQTDKALSNNAIKFSGLGTTPSNHIQSIQIGNSISENTSPQQKLEIYAKTEILNNTFTASSALITGGQPVGSASFWGLVSSASFYQVYTGIGTWSKPNWAQSVTVIAIGGGGGGGGGSISTAINLIKTGGGGGGGGEVIVQRYRASELPQTVSITVGGGGPGGTRNTPTGNRGSHGGRTIFANTSNNFTGIVARGGYGGEGGTVGTNSIINGNIQSTTNWSIYNGIGTLGSWLKTIPGSVNTYGGAAGGFGGVERSFATSSQGLPGSFTMNLMDAPALPYTIAHAAFHCTVGDSSIGTPSPITTTGGGGGSGIRANGTTAGVAGAGGSILTSNSASATLSGLTTNYPPSFVQGVVNANISQTISTSSPANYPFMGTTIGLGGRGGRADGSSEPVAGGLYGGGGGGGGSSDTNAGNGANGGNGVLIVISEA